MRLPAGTKKNNFFAKGVMAKMANMPNRHKHKNKNKHKHKHKHSKKEKKDEEKPKPHFFATFPPNFSTFQQSFNKAFNISRVFHQNQQLLRANMLALEMFSAMLKT